MTQPFLSSCAVFFVERPLSQDNYFGHFGWYHILPDYNVTFHLGRQLPLIQNGLWSDEMTAYNIPHEVARRLITHRAVAIPLERAPIDILPFIFGRRIEADAGMICHEDSNMMGQVNNRFLLLPSMKRAYPLSYFHTMSRGRRIRWHLVSKGDDASVGTLIHQRAHSMEGAYKVAGLCPGVYRTTLPNQEQAIQANIFARSFIDAGGEFPAQGFRTPGAPLVLSGLESAVAATRRGIIQNSYNFFAILEKYNPDSCTFFTPIGELGFALHEMHMISGLPYGELPYDEIVPGTDELLLMKSVYPDIYATF